MIPGLQAPGLIVPDWVRHPPSIITPRRSIITPDELWREPSRMVRLALTPVQTTGKVNTDSAASTTLTLNGVTAGNLLVVQTCVNQLVTTALAAPTGFSTAEAPTGQSFSGQDICVGIFYKENSGSGTQSATVNASSGSANYFTSSMTEWAITGTGNLDVHTNNGAASASAGNSGTTGTTAQATELCFAVIGCVDTTDVITGLTDATTGYTDIFLEASDALHCMGNGVYKNLSSTGTQIANWTWTNSGAYSAAIATFKAPSADTLMAQICL